MAAGVFAPLLLDARDLLPPTGTLGNSDDRLLMTLLSACDPHVPSMAVPAAIGHFPAPGRDCRAAVKRAAIEDVSVCCAGVALSVAPKLRSADRSLRLAAVAAVMRDLAAGSDAAPACTEHVRPAIAANRVALRERNVSTPGLAEVRATLSQRGHALAAWPELRARAGAPLLARLRPLR